MRTLALASLLFIAGCEMFSGRTDAQRSGLGPTLDRLRKTYPDLESGKFLVLADFEVPKQELLFRVVGADGQEGAREQPALSVRRSRDETGAGGLRVVLPGSEDRLLLDGQRSPELALPRDWRDYALLIFSVFGPPAPLELELAARSGTEVPATWTQTIATQPGWNLVRVDLADLGARIDLGDVRALAWRAPRAAAPVEFVLDDLIITDNTHYFAGENAGPGELYTFARGRRIHVGVRDRFELAFSNGLIVSWRQPAGDNLVDDHGLGPWPVPLAAEWFADAGKPIAYDDPALFSQWSGGVQAEQKLLEATVFRTVLEGAWRFGEPAAEFAGHRWRYAIYPSGRIFVQQVSVTADPPGWRAPRFGFAVALHGKRGFQRITAPPAAAGKTAPTFVLMARAGREFADLLWTGLPAAALARQREMQTDDGQRLAVVAGDVAATASVATTHLLRVWPPDLDGAPEGAALAADFQSPATLRVLAGRPCTDAAGDADHDGWNEAEGCYELAADGPVVRFVYEPGAQVRSDPVFRIDGTAGRRCWVYAGGKAVRNVARDAQDRLLFVLDGTYRAAVEVEVHAK